MLDSKEVHRFYKNGGQK